MYINNKELVTTQMLFTFTDYKNYIDSGGKIYSMNYPHFDSYSPEVRNEFKAGNFTSGNFKIQEISVESKSQLKERVDILAMIESEPRFYFFDTGDITNEEKKKYLTWWGCKLKIEGDKVLGFDVI